MKKGLSLLVVLITIFCMSSLANAVPYVYNNVDGEYYSLPDGYGTIATASPINIDHYYYYEWCIQDITSTSLEGESLEIVFHGIHDWAVEEDFLNVYIRDGVDNDNLGWNSYGDGQSLSIPDWSSDPNWTFIDVWSDPVGFRPWIQTGPTYDVVFTLNIDSEIASLLTNGGSFVLGIDPDCHYYGDEITVNAPVPEPATLLLLGSGLIGLAGLRRKQD